MADLDEKTRVVLPLKAVYFLSITFGAATFFLAGIYAENRGIPEKVRKIEQRYEMYCRVLRRIQDATVPVPYREEMKCED